MGRWQPDARGRLGAAAIELYLSQGFEATTVAQIAERAGVTERTFFRYFGDKREVLFAGSQELLDAAIAAVRNAPDAPALDLVAAGVDAAAGILQLRQDHARVRQSILDANPSLQERELLKMAALTSGMASALVERGVDPVDAGLAASLGVSVFSQGFVRWIAADERRDYLEIVRESFERLRALAG